jgi:hypothetical protein
MDNSKARPLVSLLETLVMLLSVRVQVVLCLRCSEYSPVTFALHAKADQMSLKKHRRNCQP